MTTTTTSRQATDSIGKARRRWEYGILTGWLVALALVRAGTLEERDPYWQIRAGIENLQGQPLTRPDSWSWAPLDNPFIQTSPLWNDLLGAAWSTGGYAGFFLLTLASLGVYLATAVALALRLGGRPLPTLGGLTVVLLLALPMLSPRATLVAQSLFMAGLLAADSWRRLGRRPPALVDAATVTVAAALLAWVGSWVHLSWMLLAPATALAWSVLWWSAAAIPRPRRWLLAAASVAGAAAGALSGPFGTSAWEVSRAVQRACEGVITEWVGMLTPGLAARWAPAGLVAIVGFVGAAVWVGRSWRSRTVDPRVGLVASLVVVGLPSAFGALQAIRFIGIALLALAPIAGAWATHLAERAASRAQETDPRGVFRFRRVRFWSQGHPWRTVLTLVLVVVAPLALLAAMPLGRPTRFLTAIDSLPPGCRLFSDPGTAGPVILLRPDVKVWIDGRADYYGRERNMEAVRLLSGNDISAAPIAGASCIMLDRRSEVRSDALADSLDSSTAWTRLPSDPTVSVWSRSP